MSDISGFPGVRTVSLPLPTKPGALPFDDGRSPIAEQYRIIRTKIVQHPLQPHLIVVTSPTPGDGKTVSAVNIAGALALLKDVQVLLVDGDLRRSSISSRLEIPSSPGLANVLSEECEAENAIVRIAQFPNLHVLPAGRVRSNPGELLDSTPGRNLWTSLRNHFRYTIVDAPPVDAVADYGLLQDICDGIVVVVRPGHTNRTLCYEAFETVPKSKLLGAVVNCVDEWFLWKTRDYSYYTGGE